MEAPTPCLQAPTWRKLRLLVLHHPATLEYKLVHVLLLSLMSLLIIAPLYLIPTSVLPLSLWISLSQLLYIRFSHFYYATLLEVKNSDSLRVSNAKFITSRPEYWEPITSHQIPNFTCRGPSFESQSPIFKHQTSSAESRAPRANH